MRSLKEIELKIEGGEVEPEVDVVAHTEEAFLEVAEDFKVADLGEPAFLKGKLTSKCQGVVEETKDLENTGMHLHIKW